MDNLSKKKCIICGDDRLLVDFYLTNKATGKRRKDCRFCCISKNRFWRAVRGELYLQESRADYRKHRSARIAGMAVYNHTHKKERSVYEATRKSTDLAYKLEHALRSRFARAFKGGYKTGSAVRDLGCTVLELKKYLESKFKPGMSWSNYGLGIDKWNIDHILPLSYFDLTNPVQVVKACHFTNLQPLWFLENRAKSDKIC